MVTRYAIRLAFGAGVALTATWLVFSSISGPQSVSRETALEKQQGPADSAPFALGLVEQRVELESYAGLPGSLEVSRNLQSLESLQAFFLIDDQLFRTFLRERADSGIFRGSFPTPNAHLSYQLLFRFHDGSETLSELYRVRPNCKPLSLAASAPRGAAAQQAAYKRADELAEEIAYLGYAISKLQYLGSASARLELAEEERP